MKPFVRIFILISMNFFVAMRMNLKLGGGMEYAVDKIIEKERQKEK